MRQIVVGRWSVARIAACARIFWHTLIHFHRQVTVVGGGQVTYLCWECDVMAENSKEAKG